MGSAAAEVAKKLNEVMTRLYEEVTDVEFLVMGIGDLAYDNAPIQASQFEYILFFRKGRGVRINHCGTSDILSIPNIKLKGVDGKNLHDTEKPVELMKILIDNSSQQNGIVLDPFMGIGSTGIACKELDRQFIGIEIDQQYYNIAQERIEG